MLSFNRRTWWRWVAAVVVVAVLDGGVTFMVFGWSWLIAFDMAVFATCLGVLWRIRQQLTVPMTEAQARQWRGRPARWDCSE